MQRLTALILALTCLGAAAGCGSDSDSDANEDSGDVEAYCEAVQEGTDAVDAYLAAPEDERSTEDATETFLEAFELANETAPDELRADYQAVLTGDGDDEAQARIDAFNQDECGVAPVDLSALEG